MISLSCYSLDGKFSQKGHSMIYIPAACGALGVCGAVAFAIYATKNPFCLLGLIFLLTIHFPGEKNR